MPNVPFLPGVPTLTSYSPGGGTLSVLAGEAINAIIGIFLPKWGLFFGGTRVVAADNVVTMDYKQEWNISDFPLEQGAFESYDKVSQPFEARLRFSAGGSVATRKLMLDSIAAIAGTLGLFDCVTPEEVYNNVNVIHYDYHRAADHGAGLIIVDVTVRQVRQSTQANFQNTASPSGASPVGGGPVAAQPATTQQATQLLGVN